MYYHCELRIDGGRHYWWNYGLEELMSSLIIPYINKQVVPVSLDEGRGILNLASVTYIQVFKTEEQIPADTKEQRESITKDVCSGKYEDCTQEIIEICLRSRKLIDTKSILQNQFIPAKKQVFVIMKFKDKVLDSAYEGVIKPIAKKYHYRPLRIDEIQNSGKITDQILEEISRSEVILADLSGEKPNCYYEAGFAHAIGREMIFTIRKGTRVHFDLATYRFIEWETEDELRKGLQSRFKAIKQRYG